MDKQINPNYDPVVPASEHKYDSKYIKITHNPSAADSGSQLIVKVPMLATDECFLANTFKLTFDVTGLTAVTPNLSSSLFDKLEYIIDGHQIYCVDSADVFNLAKDAWRCTNDDLYRYGIQSSNITKIRHDISGKDETKLADKKIADTYKTRYEYNLNHVLLDRVFSKMALHDNFEIYLHLSNRFTFKLEKICLEYVKFTSKELVNDLVQTYSLKKMFYKEPHLIRKVEVDKDATSQEINLNCQYGSVDGILMIPTNNNVIVNSKVTAVNIDVDGIANAVHQTDIPAYPFYENARSFYAPNHTYSAHMTPVKYYDAPPIYINTSPYINHGHAGIGRSVNNNINIKLTREATTNNIKFYIYLIKSVQLNIQNNRFDQRSK